MMNHLKENKMAIFNKLGEGAASTIIGMGLTQFNNKNQLKQNQKLLEQQMEAQKQMSEHNRGLAMQMWEDTNYDAQRQQMEKAGLNPALMYGMGGGGGTTANSQPSTGIGGAQADPRAMGIEMIKTGQELKLMEAQKNNIDADTANKEANTKTTDETRDLLKANMKESGTETWLRNIIQEYKLTNSGTEDAISTYGNDIYKKAIQINQEGLETKKLNADLFKTVAEQNNLEANALLTNKKAEGYWQELLNATSNADSEKIKAAATKLATEWTTGEFTNWKTWTNLGKEAIESLGKLIK